MSAAPYINYPGKIATGITNAISVNPSASLMLWKITGVVYTLLLCYMAVQGIYRKRQGKHDTFLQSKLFTIVVITIGLILLRIPNLLLGEVDTDESLWIMNAGKLLKGAIFWKTVTGSTGGPLLYAPVTIMYLLGDGINYATLRLFGLLFCILPSIILIYLIFSKWFNNSVALLLTIPLILFFAFIKSSQIVAYNGEHVVMVLTSLCLWIFLCTNKGLSNKRLLYLGIALGLLPYAKLHSAPIACIIGLCAMVEIFYFSEKTSRQKVSSTLSLLSGAVLVSFIVFIYLVINDAVIFFWKGYIMDNFFYAKNYRVPWKEWNNGAVKDTAHAVSDSIHKAQQSLPAASIPQAAAVKEGKLTAVLNLIDKNGTEMTILYGTLTFLAFLAVIYIYRRKIKSSTEPARRAIYTGIIFIGSIVTIAIPHTHFVHYFLLAVMPVVVFSGAVAGIVVSYLQDQKSIKAVIIYGALVALIPMAFMLKRGNLAIAYVKNGYKYELSDVAKEIKHYSKPNEEMTLWGEGSGHKYFVESGLVPSGLGCPIFGGYFHPEGTDFFMTAYANSLKTNNPVIFMDDLNPTSVLFGRDLKKYKPENYPQVYEVLKKNYTMVWQNDEVRLFVFNGRLAEMR